MKSINQKFFTIRLRLIISASFIFISFAFGLKSTDYKTTHYDPLGNLMGVNQHLGYEYNFQRNDSADDTSLLFKNKNLFLYGFDKIAVMSEPGLFDFRLFSTLGDKVAVNYGSYVFNRTDLNGFLSGIEHPLGGAQFFYSRLQNNPLSEDQSWTVDLWNSAATVYKEVYGFKGHLVPDLEGRLGKILKTKKQNNKYLNVKTIDAAFVTAREYDVADPENAAVLPLSTFKIKISSLGNANADGKTLLQSILVNGSVQSIYEAIGSKEGELYAAVQNSPIFISIDLTRDTPRSVNKVDMRISGGFIVQISSSGEFEPIDISSGRWPSDTVAISESEQTTSVTFEPGVQKKLSTFGLSSSGQLLTVNYNFRFHWSETKGRRSPAFFAEVNRSFNKIDVMGKFYKIDPLYTTTFFDYDLVMDDDDNDGVPGNEELSGFEIPVMWDKNDNGIYDWHESSLIMISLPAIFTERTDRNHNNVADTIENDSHGENPNGYDKIGGESEIKVTPGNFSFTAGLLWEQRLTVKETNRDISLRANITPKLPNFGDLAIQLSGHYVNDNITDNLLNNEGGSGKDPLYYSNSIRSRLFLDYRLKAIKNLELISHYYGNLNRMLANENTLVESVSFSRIRYDIELKKALRISPAIVIFKENLSAVKPLQEYNKDSSALYALLSTRLFYTQPSFLEFSYVYKYNSDAIDRANNYQSQSLSAQMFLNTKVNRKAASMATGVIYSKKDPLFEEGAAESGLNFFYKFVYNY